ncbi:MAG: hypothetical protein HDT14_02070 [Oscillibacter sp.]|nr:hypothetical protein [Oscillibacter sp.]
MIELLELKFEEDAMIAISQYMIKALDGRVEYTRKTAAERAEKQRPRITEREKSFWDACIAEFRDYSDTLTDVPDIGFGNARNVFWVDCFEEFKLWYMEIKDTYGFTEEQEKEFDGLFNALCEKMQDAAKESEEPAKINLGKRLELYYLPQMLNVNNPVVSTLLPYLLTGYVFNSWDSRFFYETLKGDFFLPRIFESDHISPDEAAKIREKIKKFVNIFSLKQHAKALIPPMYDAADDRPAVSFSSAGVKAERGIRYKVILDDVFKQWCTIISDVARKESMVEISRKECIEHSQRLYDYYTKQKME